MTEKSRTIILVTILIIIIAGSTFGIGVLAMNIINKERIPENSHIFIDSMNRKVYVPDNPIENSKAARIFYIEEYSSLVLPVKVCDPVSACSSVSVTNKPR